MPRVDVCSGGFLAKAGPVQGTSVKGSPLAQGQENLDAAYNQDAWWNQGAAIFQKQGDLLLHSCLAFPLPVLLFPLFNWLFLGALSS